MKLGILLTTPPDNENTHTVVSLSKSAIKQGHEVFIFLMYNGVYNLNNEKFMQLKDIGVKISICSHNSKQRKIHEINGVLLGSQYDNACIVNSVDRYISFGE